MKVTKIFGWILLIFGVLIILWSLYNCHLIFTKRKSLPEFFEIKQKISKIKKETPISLEAKLQQTISEQLKTLFPSEELLKLLNLIALSFFYGIFIFGGGQIASLGIKLLKR
jgi:hypothetical protein